MKFSSAIFTSPFVLLAMLLGLVVVGETVLVLQLDNHAATATNTDSPSLPPDTLHSLPRDNVRANECFGDAVAASQSFSLIGCPRQCVDGRTSGTVHLFERGPRGKWRPTHLFVRPEIDDGAMFGSALAADGDRLLIAVWPNETQPADAPIAYAYQPSGDQWASTPLYMDIDESCTVHSVSLALDGDTAIIGQVARLESDRLINQVCVFRAQSDGTWKRIATLDPGDEVPPRDNFGAAVAISGKRALIGAPLQQTNAGNTGAVHVYQESDDGQWHRKAVLTASNGRAADCFGTSVALAGDTALIGAMGAESSAMNSGQAYVFRAAADGRWKEAAQLAPNDLPAWANFGNSVALAEDLAVVGAPGVGDGTGAVYAFRIQADRISQLARYTPPRPSPRSGCGQAVSIAGNILLAGAPGEDTDNLENSGAAYVLELKVPPPTTPSRTLPASPIFARQ